MNSSPGKQERGLSPRMREEIEAKQDKDTDMLRAATASSSAGKFSGKPERTHKRISPSRALLHRVVRSRMGAVGLCVTVLFILIAVLAPILAPYNPYRIDAYSTLAAPSIGHWLGTDDLGRDVLSRLIFGTRISLQVGFLSVTFAILAGGAIGLISGYVGGVVDEAAMRVMDAILSFPAILLALGITAVLGLGIVNVIIALAIVKTPTFARLVRGEVLTLREEEYVMAARSLGFSNTRILFRHILPGVAPVLTVQSMIQVSHAIAAEASLSFLGVGAAPPSPSWGTTLSSGFNYLESAPWLWLSPGLAIFILVLSLNMFGDGLRRAVEPRSD